MAPLTHLYASLGLAILAHVSGAYAETYDYIIAGAGTAGFVVANRLSADPHITVAVIEAGNDVRQQPAVQSIGFSFGTFNASNNWVYPSVTSPALGARNLSYRAGKAWGGTSAVNGMLLPCYSYMIGCHCSPSEIV
jgi:choline dehydrogenase